MSLGKIKLVQILNVLSLTHGTGWSFNGWQLLFSNIRLLERRELYFDHKEDILRVEWLLIETKALLLSVLKYIESNQSEENKHKGQS